MGCWRRSPKKTRRLTSALHAYMKKKHLGTYPSTNVIFSIATALLLLGLFSLFILASRRLTKRLRENIEWQVLISNYLDSVEQENIRQTLLEKTLYTEGEILE